MEKGKRQKEETARRIELGSFVKRERRPLGVFTAMVEWEAGNAEPGVEASLGATCFTDVNLTPSSWLCILRLLRMAAYTALRCAWLEGVA